MTVITFRRCAFFLAGVSALALPGAALAAALERAVPAVVRILYEDGTYGEVGVIYTHPDLEGKNGQLPPSLGGLPLTGKTGNLLDSDWKFSGALKGDLNEQVSYVLLFDQPFVANTNYGRGSFPAQFNYGGTDADLDTYQISAGLAFDVSPNVKVYGGVRAQRLDADAAIPFLAGYRISVEDDWGWGGFVGAAYARPELGLRVALTYQSKISYDLDTTENSDDLRPRQQHNRCRHAAVGDPRGPDRHQREDPCLRLDPLGRLVRVRHRAGAVRGDHRPGPPASRARSSTTPRTGGPTTSASRAASPTRSRARSRSPTSRRSTRC